MTAPDSQPSNSPTHKPKWLVLAWRRGDGTMLMIERENEKERKKTLGKKWKSKMSEEKRKQVEAMDPKKKKGALTDTYQNLWI